MMTLQVRKQHATLPNAVNEGNTVWPTASGSTEDARHISSDFPVTRVSGYPQLWGYRSNWDNQGLGTAPTLHPTLPPSVLGGHGSHLLQHVNAPVEAVARQMAEVLRAVEAKVKRIQVLDLLGGRVQIYASTPRCLYRSSHNRVNRSQRMPRPVTPSGRRLSRLTSAVIKRKEEDVLAKPLHLQTPLAARLAHPHAVAKKSKQRKP